MKQVCFAILFLLVQAGCGYDRPALALAQVSSAGSTPALAPDPTSVPILSSGATSAPPMPDFTEGLAPTLEQFTRVNKSDLPAIMDYLAAQQSFLTPDFPAPYLTRVFQRKSGESYFLVECNNNGMVNCAPAASVQIQEQGLDVHLIIWEIRNMDGSSGYVSQYIYDSSQRRDPGYYAQLVSDPFGYYVLIIHTALSNDVQIKNPYTLTLLHQVGFQDAVNKWIASRTVPEEFHNTLIVW